MIEELRDTQPAAVEDIVFSQDFDKGWGKLYGNRKNIKSHALIKDTVTVGRAPSCDIVLSKGDVQEKVYSIISKQHFRICRTQRDSKMAVLLEDLSFNGTFVNGAHVGKGNSTQLRNNDDICVGIQNYHAFLFMDGLTTVEGFLLPGRILDEYVVSRKVGEGSYGVVYSVFRKETDERFAMKIIPKKIPLREAKGCTSRFESEVTVLKTLDHPFTIKVEEVVETDDAVFILMEMMDGGDLARKVMMDRPSERLVKFYFYQIALALQYLHASGITHRDLKVDNILLASEEAECVVKVADFGLAKLRDENSVMATVCGSPMYVAPEVLKVRSTGSYTSRVDIWSLGVLLYVCLSASFPFKRTAQHELVEDIMRGAYQFPQKAWAGISKSAIDLVRRMLTIDPAARPSIEEVLRHPWLNDRAVQRKVQSLTECDRTAEQPPAKRRCEDEGVVVD
ncbi:ovarian-specific serine/threonine-protein kinase Lok-like isoform X2 [Bacillus rossius redtenbacheri]|uniref:ovarian-specific serine/threonine-protein kinase Lok-like isoform X2 n=1 Tax=Bacillus rossius redtenbacheri TaxID=93214 RepID=UPI002FDE2BAF